MATINGFVVGDTLTPFSVRFIDENGSPYSLIDATFSMVMVEKTSQERKECTGPWTTSDAEGGLAYYGWQAEDVNTPGLWEFQVEITIGGQTAHTKPIVRPMILPL